MGYLKNERVPCWHEISLRSGNEPAIVLRLRNDYIASLLNDPPHQSFLRHIEQEHGSPFLLDFSKDIGLSGCLIKIEDRLDFNSFIARIPVVKKRGNICGVCKGSVEQNLPCLYCEGDGYKAKIDYTPLKLIQASMAILSIILSYANFRSASLEAQLLTFNLGQEWK